MVEPLSLTQINPAGLLCSFIAGSTVPPSLPHVVLSAG